MLPNKRKKEQNTSTNCKSHFYAPLRYLRYMEQNLFLMINPCGERNIPSSVSGKLLSFWSYSLSLKKKPKTLKFTHRNPSQQMTLPHVMLGGVLKQQSHPWGRQERQRGRCPHKTRTLCSPGEWDVVTLKTKTGTGSKMFVFGSSFRVRAWKYGVQLESNKGARRQNMLKIWNYFNIKRGLQSSAGSRRHQK